VPVADGGVTPSGAMDRLTARQNTSGDQGSSKVEGFEASVHRIKEQVLPRLLERVDPEAAATLNKDELAEEFRPIISEVLTELKINLNRREQFALEKVLVDELLGLGPLEELLADPAISDIMVNGPDQTYIERKGKLEIAQIQFRDEEHLFQIAQRIVNKVGRRIDQTSPLCDARLQDGSRVNVIVPPLSLRGTAITIPEIGINALRMRPDRIILGEIAGSECFDLLAAMNTGHDGSMATLHSNSPRECLARMENMVMMSDIKVPKEAISRQIADSV